MAGRRRCRCRAGVRHRRRSAAHVRRCVCPRRCRGLTEGVTACAVGLRLWSSGVPPARRQQGRVKSRHAPLRSAYRVMAECRRSATMSADVGGDGVTRPLAPSGSGSGVVAYLRHADSRGVSSPGTLRSAYRVMAECRRSATMCADVGGDGVTRPLAPSGWRRCSGAGMVSVEDEVRRADPLSVNPGQRPGREDEEICTAWRCRCRCSAGVCQRRRSAAHVCRRVCPRRCRGLTEDVTARAVRLCHCCAKR